jgi:hypothetical protein
VALPAHTRSTAMVGSVEVCLWGGGGSTSRSGSEHGNNKSVQERTDYEHYRSIWCQFHHLVEQNQRAGGGPTASQKRTITSSQNGLGEGSQDPSVAQTSG